MHHSFYRTISYNYLIINHTHILSTAPFIFLPVVTIIVKFISCYYNFKIFGKGKKKIDFCK